MKNSKFFFVVQLNKNKKQTKHESISSSSLLKRDKRNLLFFFLEKSKDKSQCADQNLHGDINDCRNDDKFDCNDADVDPNGKNE